MKEQERRIAMPKEIKPEPSWITDITSYKGNAERMAGIKRIHEAIAGNPLVETITPFVLLESVFEEYRINGLSGKLKSTLSELYIKVSSDGKFPLIVRRLFPDEKGVSADGPRTGPVDTQDEFFKEVEKFYKFYQDHNYRKKNIKPEIYVHIIANAAEPPKQKDPLLPYPGGDVTPLSPNKFQVRATFGADESVQGFPADVWEVNFGSESTVITPTAHSRKTESVIPWKGEYKRIPIPENFQNESALSYLQVLAIATACLRMQEKFGPHRFEFNQVRIGDEEPLVVIEATPFEKGEFTREQISEFLTPKTQPLLIIRNRKDFSKIPKNQLTFIHLPITHFQGNERREVLSDLALQAAEKGTKLVVFVAGNIATQHAVRVIVESGHVVLFVGDEQFLDDELLQVFTKDNMLFWERISPFVSRKEMEGKGLQRVGGKARGLYRLEKNGFEVPLYFVIESSLLRRVTDQLNLYGKVDQLNSIDLDTEAGQEELIRISDEIKKEILGFDLDQIEGFSDELKEMLNMFNGEQLSVRSSANCEDSQYSFAGIFQTETNIKKEEIKHAILSVIASTFTPTSVRAAKLIGMEASEIKMALIMQKMVEAEKSGVVHTKNIEDDNRNVLRIEVNEGLGEGIVGAIAKEAQIILLDKRTKRKKSEGKTILSEEELKKLVDVAISVEEKLKEGPQDIEWAIEKGTNTLYLLQARRL